MKIVWMTISTLVLMGLVLVYFFLFCSGSTCIFFDWQKAHVVSSFADCVARGFPVYGTDLPRQCRAGNLTFTEEATSDVSSAVVLTRPRPGETVASPLVVEGQARGSWFFEGVFPVKLLDANGLLLATGQARAQGEWTTDSFVDFQAELDFDEPTTGSGILVLEKDNPSGLPQNSGKAEIPVKFQSVAVRSGTCVITGCSGEVCAESRVVSPCIYKNEYSCYKTARCERQANGRCGWKTTPQLTACLRSLETPK